MDTTGGISNTAPFGRIRLTQVVESWAAEHPLNPRLLASELAGVLRTIGPGAQVLDHATASVTLYDPATGASGITIEVLADYFDRYSVGVPPHTIGTTNGAAQAGAVLLAKSWIGRLAFEAEARAEVAAGYQQTAPAPVSTSAAQPCGQYRQPPSGSTPECLALRQAQQRQEGEQSAGEKLEAAEQRAKQLEQENERLRASLTTLEQRHQQALEEAEQHKRGASEAHRQRSLYEEQLREHAGIIAFMNADNPLAPVEGQRIVAAWCELTESGTLDPVQEHGTGIGTLAERWWRKHFGEPPAIVVKRLQWALAWPARKNGGLAARRPKDKE